MHKVLISEAQYYAVLTALARSTGLLKRGQLNCEREQATTNRLLLDEINRTSERVYK